MAPSFLERTAACRSAGLFTIIILSGFLSVTATKESIILLAYANAVPLP
jgi:hypothetical protein